jgi:FMN phosphatase YigB (HAD superfamily)
MTGGGGERHPEVLSERIWDDIVKKLQGKEYKFDQAMYGSQQEFVKKIAYFFHASIQGTGCYPGAAEALQSVAERGIRQGLLADGQCFTPAQLTRALAQQTPGISLTQLLTPGLTLLSCDHKARKPSDTLFQAAVAALSARGITPAETLHVGSNLIRDIAPARKAGMKTALFAGDKASLVATPEQLKDPRTRPDVMLTELAQIAEVIA